MGEEPDLVDKAKPFIDLAIKLDNEGNYSEAYTAYYKALKALMVAAKGEKNPKSKKVIEKFIDEYMTRAEKLQAHLESEAANNGSAKAAANGAAGAVKSGGAQDDDSKKLRAALEGAVLQERPNVKWEDVAGLEAAKDALKEAVLLPIVFPELFQGKRKPWRGILLYGPPGTGKSFLAKAVATEAKSTFFSVSSSDIVSKWMGESERLVKQLFAIARENKPSIIFIDEVDALCGSRGEGESEASRRIKTELLVQMDGVGKDSDGVLVLGATNIPWQLDSAIRRRFQRRVHITLPDSAARTTMFQLCVGDTPSKVSAKEYRDLAKLAEGYSGSDIAAVVQGALMEPLRKIQQATHFKKIMEDGVEKYMPCSPGDPEGEELTLWNLKGKRLVEPIITYRDIEKAITSTRPSVSQDDLKKNAEWTEEFGSEGA